MNKLCLLAFIFWFCIGLFSCRGNRAKNDLSKANLKGKVKSVIEYEYEGVKKYGEIEKKKIISKTTFLYNETGNETEKNEEQALDYHTLLGPIKENLTETRLFAKYKKEYSDNAEIIEYNYCNPVNGLIWKIKYKYDEHGNKIDACKYWAEGARREYI